MNEQLLLPHVAQRWRNNRATYRPRGEPIDVRRYGVDVLEEKSAHGFVIEHHYSRSYPAARFRAGLFAVQDFNKPELVGAAVFSVPCNPRTIPHHLHVGADAGVELGRFVLVDEVPSNGETWFLARAFRLLRRALPSIVAVIAYSDPAPRSDVAGNLVMPGHIGSIYQAKSATYLGRARRATLILDDNGRVVSARALSKLKNDERGAAAVYRKLIAAGAPRRRLGEDGHAYVNRALQSGRFRRFPHPGNHVYAFPLHRSARLGQGEPYPKNAPRAA